ncbi:unnamed protein product [Cuscuta epithymum]|uniref:DNA ligase n=1 Tax=Cuscuta epithymum TaxID=186058 RepID=A0AAV0F671_9ASTE|nr:unnamed protein product [Cuscuta epithymum]
MTKPPPSAFDALMCGARAAAAKKRRLSPPSPSLKNKKTKSPQPEKQVPSPTLIPWNAASASTELITELKKRAPLMKKNPSEFDPRSVVCWEEGQPIPFLLLSLAFDMIAREAGRIATTDIACNLLRTVIHATPSDLLLVVYLLAKRIAPPHHGLELGIGPNIISQAVSDAYGRDPKLVTKEYEEKGDLGLVAQASRLSQSMMRKPEPLTIRKVFNTFHLIAREEGKDSLQKKKKHIKSLLLAATDCEPLYLIRLLQKKLRIGCAEQTLLAALGQAAVYAEKHSKPPPGIQSPLEEAAKIVKQVYSVLPDYDKIVSQLLTDGGVWGLPMKCKFTLGVPVGPMLSKAITSVSEILNRFQDVEFTCEYKYDGVRAQIHYMDNGSVEIYSRRAERNTGMFPDVVAAVSRLKKTNVSSFVLDCELVAYDRSKQKILPFQVLSTRPRKNVTLSDIKVDVCIFGFDLLYLNGQALLQETLKVRRENLYASFEEECGLLQFATSMSSNDIGDVQNFLEEAVNASCEGLIIKTLNEDATYEPAKYSLNWVKLKKDYLENVGDTLDLVPIGGFHGIGKRTGVYGSFLLACYDNNNEEFQSVCKVGTKFTEEMLEERCAILRSKVIPKPKAYYRCGEKNIPDVWFEASEVWEVKFSDLTISPDYQAAVGIVDSNKGISLRCPRPLRVRPDKTPEQASSSELVAEMYNAQKNIHREKSNENDSEEDDY